METGIVCWKNYKTISQSPRINSKEYGLQVTGISYVQALLYEIQKNTITKLGKTYPHKTISARIYSMDKVTCNQQKA